MRLPLWSLVLGVLAHSVLHAANAPPEIRNLKAQQRPGTYLVDITFDLVDPDSVNGVFLSAEASVDNGANYNLPAKTVTGDVGLVKPGAGKKIVWDAFADWPNKYSENSKIKIIAKDTIPIGPGGIAPVDYIWIPPGKFMMGSDTADLVWWLVNDANEDKHEVYISKGFWICNHEVTQLEYMSLIGSNPSFFKGDNLPVEQITWGQAVAFAEKLTQKHQSLGALPKEYSYRLPTEAEWEYACRAGTQTAFAGEANEMGWYSNNSGAQTMPVQLKKPNSYGLFDMHGNVWEMCSDWFGNYSIGPVGDPQGPVFGSVRVIRGGGWNSFEVLARSACRTQKWDGDPNYYHGIPISGLNAWTGFRLVISSR